MFGFMLIFYTVLVNGNVENITTDGVNYLSMEHCSKVAKRLTAHNNRIFAYCIDRGDK